MKFIKLTLLLLSLAATMLGKNASAATWHVTDDYDGIQINIVACLLFDQNCTLKEAVTAANYVTGSDTVILGSDQYLLSSPIKVTGPLTIKGQGADSSVIDGQHETWIFELADSTSSFALDSLAIRRAFSDKFQVAAILTANQQPLRSFVMNKVVVSDTTGDANGASSGQIAVRADSIQVKESEFTNNILSTRLGGRSILVRDSSFQDNGKTDLPYFADLNVDTQNVSNNDLGFDVKIQNTHFSNGNQHDTDIALQFPIERCGTKDYYAIVDSSFEGYDIGLYQPSGATEEKSDCVRIQNSTFVHNGQGMYLNFTNSTGAYGITIENSSFDGNHTAATVNNNHDATEEQVARFKNVTMSANNYYGIYTSSFGHATVQNSIVDADCASDDNPVGNGFFKSLGNNIFYSSDCEPELEQGSDFNVNPKLGPLQFNGGPTKTMAIAYDSPARDKITDGSAPAQDQRHSPRGGKADIGAYEILAIFGDPVPLPEH